MALRAGAGTGRGQERPSGDATTWNRRAIGAGDYKTVVEVSGRDQLAPFKVPSNPRDLRSVCEARTEARSLAQATLADQILSVGAAVGGLPTAEQASAHHDLGQFLAYENRVPAAIAEAEAAYRVVTDPRGRDPGFATARGHLETVLGVLNLRLGELQNCLHDHNAERCIFPILGRGAHDEPTGSEGAVRWFERHLREHPDDLEVRWLLNVAYMTLGRHPEGVPKEWLIPASGLGLARRPGTFRRRRSWPRSRPSGPCGRGGGGRPRRRRTPRRRVLERRPLRALALLPSATGRDLPRRGRGSRGSQDQLGGINVTEADYDNDGRLDLLVMRGGWEFPIRNSLLRQNADHTFTDVTEAAGLARTVHRTHSAALADYDNDGWLDLFVGHEESPSALFRNRGDGTFEDVAKRAGVDRVSFAKGATWGDYDNDGFVDLYVSNYGEPNFLYHNQGDGTFEEVARERGVDRPLMSFPTWFFDYDNDGWLDLFVASFVPSVDEVARGYLGLPARAEEHAALPQHRRPLRGRDEGRWASIASSPPWAPTSATSTTTATSTSTSARARPPTPPSCPTSSSATATAGRFVDVTTATGTGHLQKGHGVAFADLDGDGDTDIICNIGGFVPGDEYPKAVFANPGNANTWIEVRLVGVKANRSGLGARLRVTVRDADGGERRVERVVTTGGSFGASPLRQHIGLGRATAVREVAVVWPGSGLRQVWSDLPLKTLVELREGAPGFVRVPQR